MEVQYLDMDELLVECNIRNLSDASDREITEALKQALVDQLSEEEKNPSEIPQQAHEAAKKNPRQEAAKCSEKLQHLKQLMLVQVDEPEQDDRTLKMIFSKLIHVMGRLTRLASSAAVKNEIAGLFKAGNHIWSLVRDILKKTTTLNDSAQEISKVIIPDINIKEDGINPNLPVDPVPKSLSPSSDHFGNITPPQQGGSSSFYFDKKRNGEGPRSLFTGKFKPFQFNNHHVGEPQPGPSRVPHGFIPKNNTNSLNCVPGILTLDAKVCKDPSSWNLKFEGMKSHLHIERFFYRVERMAVKAYISLEGLVDYLSLCLEGEALEWYWVYLERNAGATWSQLKQDMIQRFQTSRSDDDVRRLLNQRKQLYPRESFQEFYDAVLRLALQAKNPLSDHDLYRILKRNMRPGLQLELHDQDDFPPISRFIRRCVAMEDLWKRFGCNPEANLTTANHASQPSGARYPPRVNELMQLDQEYLDSGIEFMSLNTLIPRPDINALYSAQRQKQQESTTRPIQPQQMVGNSLAPNGEQKRVTFQEPKIIICWNCGVGGHAFYDCGTPITHVFCFGCGTKDTYKPDCFKCQNRQGNSQNELRKPRDPSLVSPKIHPSQSTTREEAASNTDPELYRRH